MLNGETIRLDDAIRMSSLQRRPAPGIHDRTATK